MLGHMGIAVPDLAAAKRYYDRIMPLVGFEEFFSADDELSYRPAGGKPGTQASCWKPCATTTGTSDRD